MAQPGDVTVIATMSIQNGANAAIVRAGEACDGWINTTNHTTRDALPTAVTTLSTLIRTLNDGIVWEVVSVGPVVYAAWSGSGGVTSFATRTGAVIPATNDYTDLQITNTSSVAGTGVKGALNTLLASIGALVTGVSSVFGRAGAVVATAGDYTASLITNNSATVPGAHVSDALDALKAANGTIIRSSLSTLVSQDDAALPNGCTAYVIAEKEYYQLDTTNAFAVSNPLIVARGAGTGRWFRKSKAYVVGNFTLWCQSYGFGVVGFTPGQLTASNTQEPDISLNMTALIDNLGNQQGVVTDAEGNLWFAVNRASFTEIRFSKFLLADCLASGTPAAQLTLSAPLPTTSEAAILAFDSENGLWSAVGGHGTFGISSMVRYGVQAYESAQGIPGLTVTLNAVDSTSNQQDLVFDGQGNLWGSIGFSSHAGTCNGGIFMLTPAQIAAGGPQVPTVFWVGSNLTGPGLGSTCGLAVAPNGYIWAANFGGVNNLRAWAPTHASGNPASDVVLTCSTFNGPYSIAFDAQGNLWVQNGNDNRLQRIPAANLTSSGSVTADVVLNPPTAVLTSKITFAKSPDRSGTGSGSAGTGLAVLSVFGRTGSVAAATNDYAASQITNDSTVTGTGVAAALNTLKASIAALITGVSSFKTRTGAIAPAAGDYAASLINNDSATVAGTHVSDALDTLKALIAASVTGVSSVYGRTGAVVASVGDYAASKINNDSATVSGTHVSDALDALKAISGVVSFATRTGAITPASGDYAASQVVNDSTVIGAGVSGAINTLKASISALVASSIGNDSSVTGTTVKDALNTLKTSIAALVTGVLSFNTRAGAVVPASGDYTTTLVINSSSVVGGNGVPVATTDTDALNDLLLEFPNGFYGKSANFTLSNSNIGQLGLINASNVTCTIPSLASSGISQGSKFSLMLYSASPTLFVVGAVGVTVHAPAGFSSTLYNRIDLECIGFNEWVVTSTVKTTTDVVNLSSVSSNGLLTSALNTLLAHSFTGTVGIPLSIQPDSSYVFPFGFSASAGWLGQQSSGFTAFIGPLPDGVSIDSVSVWIFPPTGHSAFPAGKPANMPTLSVYATGNNIGSPTPLLIASVTDTSATVAAYETYHELACPLGGAYPAGSQLSYYFVLHSEAGVNARNSTLLGYASVHITG